MAQAAAFGVPNSLLGEVVVVAAMLRPSPPGAGEEAAEGAVTEAQLVAWCRERLAHYKVPTRVSRLVSWACRVLHAF